MSDSLGVRAKFAVLAPSTNTAVSVIAINTATYWYALRDYGIKDRFPGWGSLLADH